MTLYRLRTQRDKDRSREEASRSDVDNGQDLFDDLFFIGDLCARRHRAGAARAITRVVIVIIGRGGGGA